MNLRLVRSFFSLSVFALLLPVAVSGGPVFGQAVVRPVADRLTQPIDEKALVPLHGTVHRLATKANDRGAISDGMKLDRIQVVLKRSDVQEATLKKLIGDMHTPGSASYHKWLTPEDFGKQFGPSDADVAKLESWLSAKGFSITKLNAGRQTLEIAGTAGQFKDAFHAEIHSYQVKSETGEAKLVTRYANASEPQIPAALAPVFGGFATLNNFRFKSHALTRGKAEFDPATHAVKPDWTYGNASDPFFLLGPADFAVQYDLNPLFTAGTKGDGQSVAIVNEANINVAVVNRYRALFGLPVNPPQVIIDGNDPGVDGINSPYGPNGASGEAYLDVELSGASAPDAQINLVIANDTMLENGLVLAMERAVYSNISPIISLSFGECEAFQGASNAFYSGLWEQAAAQGITVLVSTGDSGSAGCDNDNTQEYAVDGQAVNGLASTAYNVAVGGTDFHYAGGSADFVTYWNLTPTNTTPTESLIKKVPEIPWNDSQYGINLQSYYADSNDADTTIVAGSGGASNAALPDSNGNYTLPYPKPSWQTGTGVPADGARDLPDVSLFGALGYNQTITPLCAEDADCITGVTQVQVSAYGGTSLATPSFAGMMALVNQKYGRQGQANFVLYPLAAQYPAVFNDVTVGTNTVPCSLISSSNIAPNDCIAVSNPITVNDPNYGTATEGEIGLSGAAVYNAGTGYDLATGLGTVDANNLVTDWGKLTFASTTTTLTPSSTSFAHGTTVTISGTVAAPAGGTAPTGDVALMTTSVDLSNQGEDFFTLSGGSYSGPISYLPGGTYDIYGYYSGDGVNGASSSTPVQITVTPESSSTALTVYTGNLTSNGSVDSYQLSSGSSVSYGALTSLSALPAASNGSTTTNPTGSVAFLDGTTAINTAVLNSEGDAEYNNAFAVGSHSITATYSGDGSYAASTSGASTFTVTKDTPTVYVFCTNTATSGTCDPISGQTTYLAVQIENTASVNGLALAPTGSVTITGAPSGTSPTTATLVPAIDPANGLPEGTALFTLPANSTSSPYSITLSYAGDTNYNTATTSFQTSGYTQTGTVPTTTMATTSAAATSPTTLVNVTATVTGSGGIPPTGTVYLVASGYILGEANLPTSAGSSATVTFNFDSAALFQGTNQITVQYIPASTSTYESSAAELTIANPLSDFSLIPVTTIVKVPGPGTTTPGIQTDVINLASYNGFSGAIGLTCTAATGVTCSLSSASATLTSGGQAATTLTVNTTAVAKAGTYSVVVTGTDPTGNVIHTIGLQVVTPLITQATGSFTLTGTAVAIAAPGDSGTTTITATPTSGFTGNIALTCAVTASPAGATGTPTCSLSPATASITGTAAATSVLTVATGSTTTAGVYTVTVTGTSGTTVVTTPITVTVSPAAATASFTLTGTAVAIAAPGDSGTSTITVTPTNSFTGSIALTCAVTASPAGATGTPTCSLSPATASITGTAAATSVLTVATGSTTTAGVYTVTVTGTSGSITQTTAVAVTVSPVASAGSFALTGAGIAVTVPSSGTSVITATPSSGFTGDVALTCAVTASPAGSTGTPTCSLNPVTASITGTTAVTSTLTVATTSSTTAGTYTVTVTGTSGSLTETVAITVVVTGATQPAETFALTAGNIALGSQGVSGTTTVTVTPGAGGFTGTVALTCNVTASPSGASDLPTCSLAPASVALAGTAAMTSTLTVATTAQTGKLAFPLFTAGGGVALAMLLFFGVPVRSKRAVRAARLLSVAALFAMLAGGAIGCGSGGNAGGGGSSGGTTTGTYTITVTGTSGLVLETTTVVVTVQ